MKPFIVEGLEKRLPELGRHLVLTNERLPEDWRENFAASPDAIEEHDPSWHQWGIVTHSLKFREMYDKEAAEYLQEWGTADTIAGALAEKIDGISKAELIRIAMPLHDLGKFRKGIKVKNGRTKSNFDDHDKISQEIILNELKAAFAEYGLTDAQINYIATCAGNHYELGFLRKQAKEHELGYTVEFTESEAFKKAVAPRMNNFNGLEIEVGLLFLADSLAKTDVIILAETDAEIDEQTPAAEDEIARRGLNPKLIDAIRQRPVNIAVARRYLEII